MAENPEPPASVTGQPDNAPAEDPAPLGRRFVLFADLLGASVAATQWPDHKVRQVIELLTRVRYLQQPQQIAWNDAAGAPRTFSVAPEITTFSDNVVLSYPEVPETLGPILPQIWAYVVCRDAIRVLSAMAEASLRIGLLLRGGFTLQPFHHHDGVTFGAGLVHAYDLERKAGMPRVILDDAVLSRFLLPPDDLLIKDADGNWHLDYFREMVRHGDYPKAAGGPEWHEEWHRAHLATIDGAIATAQASSDPKAADHVAKWDWFKDRFLKARRPLSP